MPENDLHRACGYGYGDKAQVQRILATPKGKQQWLHEKGIEGWTPLHEAADYDQSGEIVSLLLHAGAGADVEAKSDHGSTPLHRAFRNGHREAADAMLNHVIVNGGGWKKAQSIMDIRNNDDMTALDPANTEMMIWWEQFHQEQEARIRCLTHRGLLIVSKDEMKLLLSTYADLHHKLDDAGSAAATSEWKMSLEQVRSIQEQYGHTLPYIESQSDAYNEMQRNRKAHLASIESQINRLVDLQLQGDRKKELQNEYTQREAAWNEKILRMKKHLSELQTSLDKRKQQLKQDDLEVTRGIVEVLLLL